MPRVLPVRVFDAPSLSEFAPEQLDTPCIIRNAKLSWPAFGKWTSAYFTKRFPREVIPVHDIHGGVERMPLAAFVASLKSAPSRRPLYLKNLELTRPPYRALLRDFSAPRYFAERVPRLPLRSLRAHWTWIYWGGARSFSPLHFDVMMSSAWNVALHGLKRWTFVLGGRKQLFPLQGALLARDGRSLRSRLTAGQARAALRGAAVLGGTAGPGDIVYTPSGVLHQVVNETESLAITQNFVSRRFLDEFLAASRDFQGIASKPLSR